MKKAEAESAEAKMRSLERELDESTQALQHAKKAAAASDAERERAVAKHEAAEAEAAEE